MLGVYSFVTELCSLTAVNGLNVIFLVTFNMVLYSAAPVQDFEIVWIPGASWGGCSVSNNGTSFVSTIIQDVH